MTLYLCKMDPDRVHAGKAGFVAIIGRIVESGGGYRFLPNVTGHKASRKAWPTVNACIPRWADSLGYTELLEGDEIDARMAG